MKPAEPTRPNVTTPLPSILDAEGDAAMRRLLAGPALIAFDFDGTLAPIVAHPPDARLLPAVEDALRRLTPLARIVVISGRALDDLRERAPQGTYRLIGNHGNEGVHADPLVAARAQAVCRHWRDELERLFAQHPDDAQGFEIEDKGTTLSVHYRRAPDSERALQVLDGFVARLDPAPRRIGGKLLVNLLPPGTQTKFEALRQLAAESDTRRVLFVGDDDTDEIVFERAPAEWLTVRVEPRDASSARYSLATQEDVERLIERLIALLGDGSTQNGVGSP